MQNETSTIVRNLGTDDSVNVCDCCGKTGLKNTVAFETESGDVVHYGVVCASRAMGKPANVVRLETKVADDAKAAAKRAADDAAQRARFQKWVAHLVALTGGRFDYAGKPDVFAMLQAAGGYAKAVQSFTI